MVSQEKWD
jgi:hypothetical protein